jgi:chromosome segregation protein
MLKLKKIQMLGFKSFCDRTEVTLPGQGIAVVVGPNGCGKSNILDAVSWVLGEQSAKSLRGAKMEDVIFAGTRERKSLGMAEVSLSLIDPEAYAEGPLLDSPDASDQGEPEKTDWDEEELRAERAAETEEIIAEVQPGPIMEGADGSAVESPAIEGAVTESEQPAPEPIDPSAQNPVVLKVRRRRFQRTAARQGEIVVTRRLFRTGESEYLLNGKLCRLRDIQDIFMGTGLGPESYAIIEQERIGQLLSSKPHDRRAIIEEAAGITRFKTRKRLSELRLEQAKQNLARVDDIFEEVTRQMGSLKRQAAKAERYAALRDEMRTRLRVVLASRIAQMDAEQATLTVEIAELGAQIEQGAEHVAALEGEYSTGTSRGYQLDSTAKDANARANQASVDLERATTREIANQERIAELKTRAAAGSAELEQARLHLQGLIVERESHRSFLETAAAEAAGVREESRLRQAQAREAVEAVSGAEQRLEAARRYAMQLLTQAGHARNQTMHAEESLTALEQDAERLAGEIHAASSELASLGSERGQVSLKFESVTEQLQRLESEMVTLRAESETRRSEESATKLEVDRLRSEMATLTGRRNSLQSLIREHSYSTDTVRKLLKSNSLGGGLAPVGTLADFLEVSGEYETVVDAFLRDELNYIVVKSWDAAHEGMRLLKSDVDGRATFLVHPDDSQAKFSFAGDALDAEHNSVGVKRLKDCIRVLDGFGRSLEVILPKLRDGFVTPDAESAKSLALGNPNAFFLAPSGECFHNVTVTGGKPRAEGPLALKGELRETQKRLDLVEAELGGAEITANSLARLLSELAAQAERISEERRHAERESANQSAALRQMDAEVARLERRLEDWLVQSERNKDLRNVRQTLIEEKREETARLDAEHEAADVKVNELQQNMEELRYQREEAQQQAASVSAILAGLEERSRGAEAAFTRIDRMYGDLERRVNQLEQQLASATAEEQQRTRENEQLEVERERLTEARRGALEEAAQSTEEARLLREQLKDLEHNLKILRSEMDAFREARSTRSAHTAKLAVELEYMEAACVSDLGIEASELRQQDVPRLEGEALTEEDEACRGLKQKLEAMGPVNMMALDEYKETADRHGFLETQRKDLIDAIENTQSTIREIDQITHQKFDEAFARINQNFSKTFTSLFGGGQGFMRLTDEENTAESGIDIVASPPGKKLQNVLLLSGGEKALTALALLVGIFEYAPSPFCVLDEVDAPLDETNVGRLADMIKTMSGETQFLLVTHSKRMMTAADLIYGVTMQEPGVSKLVSVRLAGEEATPSRTRERTQERRLAMA